MEQFRALIISDSPDRRNYIEYYLKRQNRKPVFYPNIMSARKAVKLDHFSMIVLDLSIPIEGKLALIRDTLSHQPDAQVITIGKIEYLEKTGALSSFSSVVSINSIKSFPDKLSEYISKS
jgi:DNA-binding NtrC family response regulator